MDEDEKERIKNIVDDMDRDLQMPPYNNASKKNYSRQYQKYQKAEKDHKRYSRYEQLCIKSSSILKLNADERTSNKLSPPLKLLGWNITPGMVLSASIMVGFMLFMGWALLYLSNLLIGPILPTDLLLIMGVVPIGAAVYTYYKPVYAAKDKVIRSSGEMILSILYMVIYMRSSANLEGAVRFAALNLEGPIAKDLRGVLWNIEVGKYNDISEALSHYTESWKGYNDDFLESLQLLQAAVEESNPDRRNKLLQDSIDRILDGTRERMKHYAQGLKTPVMILNAMGAMLPVLGMIMLPLISVFMGGVITELHLFMLFNLMLPTFLYWFMQRILQSRPPTVNSKPVDDGELPERGKYGMEIMGSEYKIPTWPIGVLIFLVIGLYGIVGYFIFPHVYPLSSEVAEQINYIPGLFLSGEGYNPMAMLFRSISITLGLGLGIGVTKALGNVDRRKAEEDIRDIEKQFPTALFELGNKISGGTPIEVALRGAAESTSDMEISELFDYSLKNMSELGMTFEEAVFDSEYGAIKQFPSQMINTVMKAIIQSSEKGTKMASMAMLTVSRYLDNIHETQEKLNDLMEETTTTIQMLAYLLAPVVSGVAVGMSQTIIIAMYQLSSSFGSLETEGAATAPGGAGAGEYTNILGNLNAAVAPELLQLVVGVYLIQLLWILSTFYMKIEHGEDITYRNVFAGKVIISGMIFYTITLLLISLVFGGIIPDAPASPPT